MTQETKEKSVYESALRYEISHSGGVAAIAAALGITEYFTADRALDWLDNPKRTKKEMKDVLLKIGYKSIYA